MSQKTIGEDRLYTAQTNQEKELPQKKKLALREEAHLAQVRPRRACSKRRSSPSPNAAQASSPKRRSISFFY